MTAPRGRRGGRAGYTVIEVAIAVALVTTIMGGSIVALWSGQRSFQRTMTRGVVSAQASRALNRIADLLGAARRASVDIGPQLDSVRFVEVAGWSGSSAIWSGEVVIRLEYETGELDNGVDDDQDGFVDECQVVYVQDAGGPNEVSVVLVRSVRELLEGEDADGADNNGNLLDDERGLCFELQHDALVVRLTLQKNHPEWGPSLQTLSTIVALRN